MFLPKFKVVRRSGFSYTDIPILMNENLEELRLEYLRFWNDKAQEEFQAALFFHKDLKKVTVQLNALPPSFRLYKLAYARHGLLLRELELTSMCEKAISISLLGVALKFNESLTKLRFSVQNHEPNFMRLIQHGNRLKLLELSSDSFLSSAEVLTISLLLRKPNQLEQFHCGFLRLPLDLVVDE